MSAPKSDTATIEARKNRLLELLAEGKTQTEASDILRQENYPADLRTVQRDVRSLRGQWGEANMNQYELLREQQLREVEEDKAELRSLRAQLESLSNPNDRLIDPFEVIELALKILDRRDTVAQREMKLTGTAAPSKAIIGHMSGPKLDSLYLDIREVLLDLSDGDKQEALLLMRDFAKSHRKPVVVDAMPMQRSLTDGKLSSTSD